jgi:hypothetical protein
MKFEWIITEPNRSAIRCKMVDLSYCLQCRRAKGGHRKLYDFCCYDGMPIVQSDDENFEFWCFHFSHWRLKEIPQY